MIENIADWRKVVFGKPSKSGKGGTPGESPDVKIIDTSDKDKDKDKEKEKDKDGDKDKDKDKDKDGDKDGDKEGGKEGGKEGADREATLKKAQELLDSMNANGGTGKHSCGSNRKRNEQNVNNTEDNQARIENERKRIQEIQQAIQDAVERGVPNVYSKDATPGTSKEGTESDYIPLPMPKPRPKFLDAIKDFAKKGFKKSYTKKGTDWLYTDAFDNSVFFKDRPKVVKPTKWLFLMVDCSGSMTWDFSGDGKSLLEHLVAYLPVIAKEFDGEVWWISNGILTFKEDSFANASSPSKTTKEILGKKDTKLLAITNLSEFKGSYDKEKINKIYDDVTHATGFGSGTSFAVELQLAVKIREKDKHNAAIIVLTDSDIDTVQTTYMWEGKETKGQLPPNTIIMTNTNGVNHMERDYKADLDSDKKISVYDITEDGKYQSKKR